MYGRKDEYMKERVQKILAQWGIASRREAEQLIQAQRVRLNGEVAVLGDKADPATDCLEVDGRLIRAQDKPRTIYILLNKPLGVVTSCFDPQNRPTVLDLLGEELSRGQGIHPVGRLDINSTGALLLTNDGELTLALTHPRYHLEKIYQVWIDGLPSERQLAQWREGMFLGEEKTLPAQVQVMQRSRQRIHLEVRLREGKNRQIRRIVEQMGLRVVKLHRTAIGSIQLQPPQQEPLALGKYRFLHAAEEKFLEDHRQLSRGLQPY